MRRILALLVPALLAGCGSLSSDGAPPPGFDASHVENAVPRELPRSRYGNPDHYTVFGHTYHVLDSSRGYDEKGIASWYGTKFHGQRTSSGESYDMYKMTAAHKTLPLPTFARVTNLQNGRSVIVKINDRGPFHENRIIDLSYAAAMKLGVVKTGTAMVEVQAIDPEHPNANPAPPPARPGTQIYVQAGAFSDADNAYRLLGELLKAGLGRTKVQKNRDGGTIWYRVRIGPLGDADAADRITARLDRLGVSGSVVVTEE